MTTIVVASPPTARPTPVLRASAFELQKLLAPWRTRLLISTCWTVPALLVAVISTQSSLPTDTVFGRWMGTTGWAGSLVVLSFSCSWVLPLMTSLVTGDAFAVEDRLGTWGSLLVATRSAQRVFVAKALAGLAVVLVMVTGLAASSVVGGLLTAGDHSLVGLDGHALLPGQAAATVALAWVTVLGPTLAFAAIGLLGSVALGRSSTGLLLPALLALLLQLLQLLPLPLAVRVSLPSYGLLVWRGLFTAPVPTASILLGSAVSLAWAVVTVILAFLLFRRRDFTSAAGDGLGQRALAQAALPLAALLAVTVGGVAAAAPAGGIARPGLEHSLATAFAHLYRLQSRELHRPDVTEQQLGTRASCDKGGPQVEDVGPGHDWRCVVSWHIPGADVAGAAVYQLDVTADGRYVADGDGPQAVNGSFTVHTGTGDLPNPLWQVDGSIDLLNL
jgi:ABC-2 type transport system permease protein